MGTEAVNLRDQQALFTQLIGRFIAHAYEMGFELTFGEAMRTPEQAAIYAKSGKGIANSLHIDRLAVDFNLFLNGKYIDTTEGWRGLGEWWEKQHALCRWGGRFNDGNHLSMEYGGRK